MVFGLLDRIDVFEILGATMKNWLFPSLSFVAFLYVLLLFGIWTYRVDSNTPLFGNENIPKGVTTLKDFKQEMQEYVK